MRSLPFLVLEGLDDAALSDYLKTWESLLGCQNYEAESPVAIAVQVAHEAGRREQDLRAQRRA
jgi:hypothetical protein